jgi:glycosyltransferase involved in cell wall biosynthesis
MIILSYIIFGFLILRLLIALINLLTKKWLSVREIPGERFVSILIPARNEKENIGKLLDNIIDHDYKNYEVIVYDDMSEDTTPEIVKGYAENNKKISCIRGVELPEGWLGKNYACHQLSLKAKGSYFLFLDADVIIEKGLIRNSLGHFKNNRIALLSIFPQQIMVTLGEKLTIPLMNWILVSMLPLILIEYTSNTSLSAANGQFMLFNADIYRKNQWHKKVSGHKVEDIEIVKSIKRKGYIARTVLSNGQIKCRMYKNYKEGIEGFSKNVTAFFGNSIFLTILFAIITSFGIFVILFTLNYIFLAAYIILSILLRIIVSILSRQNVLTNILLSIPQQIAFIVVVFKAVYNKTLKYGNWKGRQIKY